MKQNTLSALKSESAETILNRNFPPRDQLLSPWLRTQETCVVWAASGIGKTMLSLSLALAIAGGGAVGGWEAPQPRRVLYIDGEMHIQDIRERLELLSKPKLGLLNRSQRRSALKNLQMLARQDQEIDAPFYDLTEEETHNALFDRVKKEKVDLVILDNFTTLSDGLDDENAATSFKKVQSFFLQLKRLGVATVLVHHSNKSGRDMRGSTALATTFEVIIGLKRPKVSRQGEARFILEFGKFRGKGDGSLANREWKLTDDGWVVADEQPDDPKDDPVYAALTSLRFISYADIGRELGLDRSTVKRRIDKLVAMRMLKQEQVDDCIDRAIELRRVEESEQPGPSHLHSQLIEDTKGLFEDEDF